ncbi:GNAT family N-acetyltransferase [candidate division KSB1 bacterium]|nr:MAG: GNAT family N-acetyltransferase [candidate division KSB1 bacterium]
MNNFANLPGFTLRELAPSDIETFIEIGLPTCAFMHGRLGASEKDMRQRFTSFVRDYAFERDSEIFMVEAPDRTIAAQLWLHITHNRFNGLRELWIWDVTVREAYRRRGIGKNLLEFAKNRALESYCKELWLLVSSINDKAVKIYQSAGMGISGHLLSIPVQSEIEPISSSEIEVKSAVLRPLRGNDLPALFDLWTAAGLPFRPQGRDHEDRLARYLNGLSVGGWGAFISNTLAGAALISYDGRKGWIERLATRPEHRGTGIAKAIVAAATQSLKDSGAFVIAALIEEENTASRRLFESCGYKHSPTICYYSTRDGPES